MATAMMERVSAADRVTERGSQRLRRSPAQGAEKTTPEQDPKPFKG
jgi:hypothetical protein